MMRISHTTSLLLLAVVCACSMDTPTGPQTPEVRFEPKVGGLLVAQGSFTRFVARDPDGQPMTAVFRVDGVTKHRGTTYNWNAPAPGSYLIEAEVDLQTHTRTGVWSAEVRYVDVEYVPPVSKLSAAAGDRWATLDVRWDRPEVQVLYPEISSYRVYYSQVPYASIYDSEVTWIEVDDVASRLEQSMTLFDLDPETDSYLQIVAMNDRGASSIASSQIVARSRGAGSIDLPPPTGLLVETPQEIESLAVQWEAPVLEPGSPPLDFYRVYWAVAPFAPDQVEFVEQAEVAAADPSMSYRIDGLLGQTVYYVRVQAFGSDGRVSALSVLEEGLTRETPTPFTLSGRAIEIAWDPVSLRPLAGAGFSAGTDVTTSDASGNWLLPTMTQGELYLDSDSGGQHYAAHIAILGSEDRSFDVFFLPKRTVDIVSYQAPLNGPMSQMEFLHRFTGTRGGTIYAPKRIYRWESYPVPVQISTLVREGSTGETVDYEFAFERAVGIWNSMVGRELMQLVPDAPEIGVSVVVDVPDGAAVLGETRFVDPPNSWFNEDAPRHLRIHLAEFNFQALANRVILHELGHVLGLLHSPSIEHVMGSAAPDFDLTVEEAEIARLLSLLPQATPLSWYLEE